MSQNANFSPEDRDQTCSDSSLLSGNHSHTWGWEAREQTGDTGHTVSQQRPLRVIGKYQRDHQV